MNSVIYEENLPAIEQEILEELKSVDVADIRNKVQDGWTCYKTVFVDSQVDLELCLAFGHDDDDIPSWRLSHLTNHMVTDFLDDFVDPVVNGECCYTVCPNSEDTVYDIKAMISYVLRAWHEYFIKEGE